MKSEPSPTSNTRRLDVDVVVAAKCCEEDQVLELGTYGSAVVVWSGRAYLLEVVEGTGST